jgi:hypothetical protein
LRLPGELRNRIYEYVFHLSEERVKHTCQPNPKPRKNFTSIHILATCRTIRHEASAIFWNTCRINAGDLNSVLYLDEIIGPSVCSRITSIIVDGEVAHELFQMEMLEKLPSLRQVRVLIRMSKLYFACVREGTPLHCIKRVGDGSREMEFTLALRFPLGEEEYMEAFALYESGWTS